MRFLKNFCGYPLRFLESLLKYIFFFYFYNFLIVLYFIYKNLGV